MNVEILEKKTGLLVTASIAAVLEKDLHDLAWNGDDKGRFPHFDWRDIGRFHTTEIFKLEYQGTVMGLIKFFHEDLLLKTIELNKIELSKENVGTGKEYDLIAGCLIAFACLHAQRYSSGALYVFSKEVTKEIYLRKYGMAIHDAIYAISDKENCKLLISKFLSSSPA